MELFRRVASFGTSVEDLRNIYILFIRSQLEQSSVVWHSSLTDESRNNLERVQKTAVKIILGDRFQGYKKGLDYLNLLTLEERREHLCLKFALKCTKNEKTKEMFPLKEKHHNMDIRTSQLIFPDLKSNISAFHSLCEGAGRIELKSKEFNVE